jgi:hypothetical protein
MGVKEQESTMFSFVLYPFTFAWGLLVGTVLRVDEVVGGVSGSYLAQTSNDSPQKKEPERMARYEEGDMAMKEIQSLREKVTSLRTSRNQIHAKFKQLHERYVELQQTGGNTAQTPSANGDHAFADVKWPTHVAVLIAYLFNRALYNTGENGNAEHQLMAALISWPVFVIYCLWLFKWLPDSPAVTGLLTAMSWVITGYVLHAMLEEQLHHDDMKVRVGK